MGTRNLTAVYSDGQYKIAQYGQWDGYPSGQGITVLRFMHKIMDNGLIDDFRKVIRKTKFFTEREIERIDERIHNRKLKNWQDIYPELSRDTGAEILDLVYSSRASKKLHNSIEFAADSVFCEWAWVIDLDRMTFEGYKGFNKEELTPDDRFYFLRDEETDEEYHGVKMVASWDLNSLPNDEDFLAAFKEEE